MTSVRETAVPLGRDGFMGSMIRHLSGTLQDVIGMCDAEGFVSIVGQRIGDDINDAYRRALSVSKLSREEVLEVLVDLKRRIDGEFTVVEETEEKIVLRNSRCPFGDSVEGRPSLCMMTSNVFGVIAAENLGYAKVHLARTIAEGHGSCEVVIYLQDSAEALSTEGREYFDYADDI